MLAVRDDELDVGDNGVASSDVAEGGKTLGTQIRLAGPGFPRVGGHVVPYNPLS
jgi:hypothetical protein